MKKTITFLSIISIVFSGCFSSYYQVYNTQSDLKLNETKDFYIYENEDLKLVYNFWGEGGPFNFLIHNKSDKPIYIDWKKSSFIWGQTAMKYWEDVELTKTTSIEIERSKGIQYQENQDMVYNFNGSGLTFSKSITTKSERITFIPPGVTVFKNGHFINTRYVNFYPGELSPVIREMNNRYQVVDFSKESSPVKVRNYLTYSKSEKFDSELAIDNQFWIEKIYVCKVERPDESDPEKGALLKVRFNAIKKGIANGTGFYVKNP